MVSISELMLETAYRQSVNGNIVIFRIGQRPPPTDCVNTVAAAELATRPAVALADSGCTLAEVEYRFNLDSIWPPLFRACALRLSTGPWGRTGCHC